MRCVRLKTVWGARTASERHFIIIIKVYWYRVVLNVLVQCNGSYSVSRGFEGVLNNNLVKENKAESNTDFWWILTICVEFPCSLFSLSWQLHSLCENFTQKSFVLAV